MPKRAGKITPSLRGPSESGGGVFEFSADRAPGFADRLERCHVAREIGLRGGGRHGIVEVDATVAQVPGGPRQDLRQSGAVADGIEGASARKPVPRVAPEKLLPSPRNARPSVSGEPFGEVAEGEPGEIRGAAVANREAPPEVDRQEVRRREHDEGGQRSRPLPGRQLVEEERFEERERAGVDPTAGHLRGGSHGSFPRARRSPYRTRP